MTVTVHEPSATYLMQKQADNVALGILPREWNVKSLSELSEFITSGSRGWASYYSESGATFIRSQNVLKGRLDFSDHQCVVPPVGSEGSRTRVELGDLLITITGNSVGNVAYVDRPLGEAYISQHVGLVRLKDPASATFVCRFLSQGAPGNVQIVSSQSGQSKPGLNLANLRDFVVAVPPEEEQRKIATALSDADALIAGLERLIAKKRDIKQAAMQQLLTGQTRLPGFSGEWCIKRLGDIAPLQRGFDLPTPQLRPGLYPVVYSNGVLASHDQFQAQGPGVVTGRSGTLGAMTYIESGPYWPHNTSLWVTSFRGNDPKFVYYLYAGIGFERFASGSGVPTLNRNDAHAFKICVPVSLAEQASIAKTFSDMDVELSKLESRLAKTRAIKQGMMQELLTGRTRLI